MSITRIPNWAKSAKNQDISLLFSDSFKFKSEQKPILFIGGVHGDEPEGVRLAEELILHLENSTQKYAPWVLIPCLNPDGYKAKQRTNGNGVDLNRNYPSKNWSKEFSKDRYYPGPRPGSEPEIQALIQFIKEEQPRLIVHFHSWEPCIVYAGEPGKVDAKRLSDCSGYELKDDIGYPTPGSLSAFGWKDLKIPVICIEEQEGEKLDTIWSHFAKGLEEILLDESLRK
ncbi:MAG: DUF2817 domain-containing protein [Bdellovibrionales bacterium]|nr:DUF2817 domain-containing protein [Bdellovibrionales bacterium]